MKKLFLPYFLVCTILIGGFLLVSKVAAQSSADCLRQYHGSQAKCSDAARACIDACPGAQGVDLGPLSECFRSCDKQTDSCNEAAEAAYDTCIEAQQPQSSQTPSKQDQDEENLLKKVLGGFPVFIGEWFSAVSTGIKGAEFIEGMKNMGEAIFNDPEIAKWEEEQRQKNREAFESFMKARGLANEEQIDAVINRMPKLGEISDDQTGEWQQDSPFRLDILNGQAQIKHPGSNEWKEIKVGDRIPPGSAIFTGMDTTTILSIKDKGVVEILPFSEITVSEQGLEQASQEGKTSTDIYLRKGEIELNVEPIDTTPAKPGFQGWGMSVYGPYYSAAVRGTHFWVKQEEGKQFAAIGVYEGEVEVKTKDGKTTTVVPNGDKPGVIVVTQKLSGVKLALAGLVLAGVIGGAIFFLKRKRRK